MVITLSDGEIAENILEKPHDELNVFPMERDAVVMRAGLDGRPQNCFCIILKNLLKIKKEF